MGNADGFAGQVHARCRVRAGTYYGIMSTREVHRVGDVPALVHRPDTDTEVRGLVVWLPFLGGAKGTFEPVLKRAAASGFVGVGIDPRRHGERADIPGERLREEVMGMFRAVMWPILGGTTLDARAVVDWAHDRYHLTGPVLAGGVSMGGDIAVALAGIDSRVQRVAAIAATPDWTRPGMTRPGQPGAVLDQGEPSQTGQRLYEQFDPLTHPGAFARDLHMRFDVGTADTHVPGEAARRFARLLAASTPTAGVEVVEHAGLDHMDVASDQTITETAVTWLLHTEL